MFTDWYVSLRCSQCHRIGGVVLQGSVGEERQIGCRECGKAMIVYLEDNQRVAQGPLSIDLGVYELGWCG
jgi:DNA-directed RNA polymerase subunit RPC12/RpoP